MDYSGILYVIVTWFGIMWLAYLVLWLDGKPQVTDPLDPPLFGEKLADQTKRIAKRDGGRVTVKMIPGVGYLRTTVTRSETSGVTYVTKEIIR